MSVQQMFNMLNLQYNPGVDVSRLAPGEFTKTDSGHIVVRHIETGTLWALGAKSLQIGGDVRRYQGETQAKLGFLREYAASIGISLPIYS